MTQLYVAIATAGRAESLHTTLRALAACVRPAGFRRVVVVENGPRCGAEQVVARASASLPIQYLHHPRANKSNALNVVLREITRGFIVFLDDDVRFEKNLLSLYARAASADGRGVFMGGAVRPDYVGSEPEEWLKAYLPASVRGLDYSAIKRHEDVPPFLGFNWAAYAEDLIQVGGFDPRFGPGSWPPAVGQETEMQFRLLANGARRVFLRDAVVTHRVPAANVSARFALLRTRRGGVRDAIIRQGAHHRLQDAIVEITRRGLRLFAKRLLRKPSESCLRERFWLHYALGALIGIGVRTFTGGIKQGSQIVVDATPPGLR